MSSFTCPVHLINRPFYVYCAEDTVVNKHTMVNKTNPYLLSCITHFSEVDQEKENKDADKIVLVVKK